MIVKNIKGKVLDENGKSIPSALVYLSKKDGALVKEFRTRTDVDGNYELPFLATIASIPLAQYITAKMTLFPTTILPIDSNSDLDNFNIVMEMKNQDVPFVTYSGKDQLECSKKGGTWDSKTKTCTIPKTVIPKTVISKTWWQKNWWWLVGGLALTASAITIIVVKKKQK